MSKRTPRITVVRAYSLTEKDKGYRVLVDRLWPRGVKKETLALDRWWKELAPSTELRKWFHESPPDRWEQFRKKYIRELNEKSDDVGELLAIAAKQPVLLIYGARDELRNHAIVLCEFLLEKAAAK